MSPEQVRGQAVDHRSDLFSLGCVLYEMLTGRRAFQRETAAETMTAILKEDPPEIADSGVVTPPAMDRLVRHCLEKRPEERFQSAQDVAFDLETALEPSGRGAPPGATGPLAGVSRSRSARLAAIVTALAVALAAGIWYGRHHAAGGKPEVEPSFRRLSFTQGTTWGARFTPDGRTVIYSAALGGQPLRLYHTRTDSSDATPLALPDAHLLSVSPSGEMAISLGHRFEGWMGEGTLARSPLLGGGARPVLEHVREAEWAPDGSQLAIVHRVAGREVLEYPAGKVLYETSGFVSHIRFSPRGDRIAFADHPLFADDIGAVAVVDLAGRKSDLTSSWSGGIRGLAWSPAGDEVWFTAARGSEDKFLRAVDMSGRERVVLGGLADLLLFDVARDGRALLGRENSTRHIEALVPGSAAPRDFSLARFGSMVRNISADPRAIAITDQSGNRYEVFLRTFDGSLPVHLGEGDTFGISPDGRWTLALTRDSPPRILLHPTGPGQTRELPNPEGIDYPGMKWLSSGRIVAFGAAARGRMRGSVIDPADGSHRPFTEEGVEPVRFWSIPVSPDGARVVARDSEGRVNAYPVDGGSPVPIDGLSPLDVPLEWSSDGRALFVAKRGEASWKIRRHELASGRETAWTEITPAQPGGIRLSQVFITPDGRYWVHGYSRLMTDLYLAEGLR
jgi:eukaryotic-like serine/threonine-protein kinase